MSQIVLEGNVRKVLEDFIGIELKHEYCELGRKRMKENK
jgi:hypothetical protein